MDRIKGQKQQTGIIFEKTQILKMALQFLISVFFFLFSYFSLISFLDLSFNLNFSTIPVQLLDYTIGRKYMFLLCIVILAFLAMSSGLMSSSPVEMADINDDFHGRYRDDLGKGFDFSEKKALALEDEVVLGSSKKSESALVVLGSTKNSESTLVLEGRGGNGCLIKVGRESSFVPASVVAAEDEGEGSKEEFNKKCEDFIRNFKHRIKTEAQ